MRVNKQFTSSNRHKDTENHYTNSLHAIDSVYKTFRYGLKALIF